MNSPKSKGQGPKFGRKTGWKRVLLFFFLSPIFYFPFSATADTSFTAGEAISAGNVLVLQSAANTVYKTTAQGQTGIVGVAANDASAGAAVYVRQSGGKVPVNIIGTVAKGNVLRASAVAGAAENAGGMTAGAFAIAAADGSGGQCTATLMLGLQGSGIIGSHGHTESDISDLEHDAQKIKGKTLDDTGLADGKIWKYQAASDSWVIGDDAGATTGAPVGAPYITQMHDATLTNEQALSDLATGLLKNITATGVLEIAVAGADYAAPNHIHSASDISDFDTEVSNNGDVATNTAARHSHANSAELDLISDGDHDVRADNPHSVTAAQTGAAALAPPAAAGNLAALTVVGDIYDSGSAAADFAAAGHNHDSDYGSLSGESGWSGTQDFSGATVVGTGGFIDRGDPAAFDFQLGDFTTDGAYHDLDLSSIVPVGAIAVMLRLQILDNMAGSLLQFRKNGVTGGYNNAPINMQVAGISVYSTIIVPCDENRMLEYFATNTTWTAINVVVMGWFL